MKPSRTIAILAVACALLDSGCSFLFVNGPPTAHQREAFEPLEACTDSLKSPTTDTVLAAGIPLFGLALAAGPGQGTGATKEASANQDRTFAVMGISSLVISAVLTTSAIWGFHTVKKCRRYLE
jgi:uncharacterized membrane protein YdbT with pleckstrin-like domain